MDTFWGLSTTAWTAIYTLLTGVLAVTAVAAAWYARRQWLLSREQLTTAREAQLETMRPYVIVDAESIRSDRQVFDLVIRNTGLRPALKVTVKIDPPPRRSWDSEDEPHPLYSIKMLNEPIHQIAPGQEFRTLWDDHPERHRKDLPWLHHVDIAYLDSFGEQYSERSVIDLAALCGTEYRVEKTTHHVAKSLAELNSAVQTSVALQRSTYELLRWEHQTRVDGAPEILSSRVRHALLSWARDVVRTIFPRSRPAPRA